MHHRRHFTAGGRHTCTASLRRRYVSMPARCRSNAARRPTGPPDVRPNPRLRPRSPRRTTGTISSVLSQPGPVWSGTSTALHRRVARWAHVAPQDQAASGRGRSVGAGCRGGSTATVVGGRSIVGDGESPEPSMCSDPSTLNDVECPAGPGNRLAQGGFGGVTEAGHHLVVHSDRLLRPVQLAERDPLL
jgi:hypothetical protein